MLHHTFSPMLPTQVRAVATSTDIVCLMISGDSALEVSAPVFSINASLCCKLSLQDCVCLVNPQSSLFCFSKGDDTKVIFCILVIVVLWLFTVLKDRTVR